MTTPTSHEDQLIERLHSLADTIDGPVPTAAVVRRGRAAVRRNRILGTAAALSVLTCTGVLGVGSGLLGHSGDSQALAGPAGSSKTAARSISAKHTAKRVSHHKAPDTSCSQTGPQRAHELDQEYGSTLQTYADIVVDHLDPQQVHMRGQDATAGPITFGRGCVLNALSTRLGWRSAGDNGLGMVMVEVTTDWRQSQTNMAHGAWQPAGSLPAGAVHAYVDDYDGGTAVAVTRADGTTVALDAARLFGNNSVTPVASMDVTTDELLATAADARFQMP